MGGEDPFDVRQELLVRLPGVPVHRDVDGLQPAGGAHPGVGGGGRADFNRLLLGDVLVADQGSGRGRVRYSPSCAVARNPRNSEVVPSRCSSIKS